MLLGGATMNEDRYIWWNFVSSSKDKIETAIEPRFQEHFVAANAIPHATEPFPELAQVVALPTVSFNVKAEGTGGRRRRRR